MDPGLGFQPRIRLLEVLARATVENFFACLGFVLAKVFTPKLTHLRRSVSICSQHAQQQAVRQMHMKAERELQLSS